MAKKYIGVICEQCQSIITFIKKYLTWNERRNNNDHHSAKRLYRKMNIPRCNLSFHIRTILDDLLFVVFDHFEV